MSLPFPKGVLEQHAAVLGKTGSGKSSAVRVVVEHLLDHGKRVCVVDPKGDWWGLKAAADGKAAGYPIITFGDFKGDYQSDVPINKESGKHIAELVTSGNRPCIIGFRGWFTADMLHFWIAFAKTLFHSNEGELFLIIDETQNFAPKGSTRMLEGQGGLALHWTNRLLAEGRGLGINIWVCSQRPQKVHNDTLDGCETLVAMRVVHPAARGAIKDWIDGAEDKEKGKQILDQIGGMKRGEAIIWSPEIEFGPKHVVFPMFKTFDSFAPPQLQKKVSQRSWADVDLDAVKEKLASVIEEAKQNDPKALRQENTKLKMELLNKNTELVRAHAAPSKPDKKQTIRASELAKHKRIAEEAMKFIVKIEAENFEGVPSKEIKDAVQSGIDVAVKRLESAFESKMKSFERLKTEAGRNLRQMKTILDSDIPINVAVKHNEPFTVRPPAATSRPAPAPKREVIINGEFRLAPRHQELINALAFYENIEIRQIGKNRHAAFVGRANDGGYRNDLSALRTAGIIEYPNQGEVTLTEHGRTLITELPNIQKQADLHKIWLDRFPPRQAEILRTLLHIYPDPIGKDELAATINRANDGGFRNDLSAMRTLGTIDYPRQGTVIASENLFPPIPA